MLTAVATCFRVKYNLVSSSVFSQIYLGLSLTTIFLFISAHMRIFFFLDTPWELFFLSLTDVVLAFNNMLCKYKSFYIISFTNYLRPNFAQLFPNKMVFNVIMTLDNDPLVIFFLCKINPPYVLNF